MFLFGRRAMTQNLTPLIKAACEPLPNIDSTAFGSFFDRFANSRVVLIGDASHGTSEFYRARAAITKHLITKYGFSIVAIEGDWPDCHALDSYVRQHPHAKGRTPIPVFKHFPEWMWRNEEMQDFVDWLRLYNEKRAYEKRAGIFGLDLYSMAESIRAVIRYLEKEDPELAKDARRRYGCLKPWMEDPGEYGRHSMLKGYAPCEKGVVKMLQDLMSKRIELSMQSGSAEGFLDTEMNARLVKDSEQYYRSMYWSDASSWNLRDSHMFETLARLLKIKPSAKAVVWAHNSHVGDARATGMKDQNELNLGQLCRQHFSNAGEVSIIGCGTHDGEVAAAHEWDAPMEIMKVLPSRSDSYERIMHDTGIPSFILDLRMGHQNDDVLEVLQSPKLERFIGVIYRPTTEKWSHYIKSVLPRQFDAYVWFDRTTAVTAFEVAQPNEPISKGETYPFGL